MQECVSEFISFITSEGECSFADSEKSIIANHHQSLGEMPAGEAQNREWGRYSVRYDLAWFRKLCRGAQNLFVEISRGKTCATPHAPSFHSRMVSVLGHISLTITRPSLREASIRTDHLVADTRGADLLADLLADPELALQLCVRQCRLRQEPSLTPLIVPAPSCIRV